MIKTQNSYSNVLATKNMV